MTQFADASTPTSTLNVEPLLQAAKSAFYQMATLSTAQKNEALLRFADLVESNAPFLLSENAKDLTLAEQSGLETALRQRLKLDAAKLPQLVQGLRDVATLADPAGVLQSSTLLDDGLILERRTVPLGVIGIIFESRPDVIPQILSLILKSGNVVVFKGGKEAQHSIAAFMSLLEQLNAACDFLPAHWATMLDSREAIRAILDYPQYVDLVIPRGSNALVQSIMNATKIPVLGHADGVCHLYVHSSAPIERALAVTIDSKIQYPSACNALETLLIDATIALSFLPEFVVAATKAGITLRVCERTLSLLPAELATLVETATEADWQTEYGDLTLSVKIVDDQISAMAHINQHGSHHTDAIVATDPSVITQFMNGVDSACVFANASTRFADGFRFGLGAEIGISTSKTHARGPVGLEGLVIYQYQLRGEGQIVADYAGQNAKPFRHQSLHSALK